MYNYTNETPVYLILLYIVVRCNDTDYNNTVRYIWDTSIYRTCNPTGNTKNLRGPWNAFTFRTQEITLSVAWLSDASSNYHL